MRFDQAVVFSNLSCVRKASEISRFARHDRPKAIVTPCENRLLTDADRSLPSCNLFAESLLCGLAGMFFCASNILPIPSSRRGG
jgi:hypothetical protein